jgi:L,D-peptidoglycan transpeptidase YkuD (ErfK/YbiS/YcfS/YnhG family)
MVSIRIRLAAVLAAAVLPAITAHAQDSAPPLQAVVATTDGWDATTARVRLFARRTPSSPWVQVGAAMSASVGRTGLGWGTGLHAQADQGAGPVKREGDGKAPAGIFRLSSAFGYAPADSARWIRLPYHASDPSIECVDDSASRFYNQRVDRDTVTPDWTSHEEMRRADGLYRWGVWVDHNTGPAVAGRGSCIFIHIRSRPGAPTVGCTAFAEEDVRRILRWLDPRKRPVLVQLPEAEYRRLRRGWRLP